MKYLNRLEEGILLITFPLMTVITLLGTSVRYFQLGTLTWSEEATRYMFIWFVFMGMSYGIRNGTHIRVNIIEVLCPKVVPLLSWIQDIVGAAFVFYLTPAALRAMPTMSRSMEPASTRPWLWSVWLPPISVRPGAL